MNDRELLELAAKAAGIEAYELDDGSLDMSIDPSGKLYGVRQICGGIWNPLADDGYALRLAVYLQMDILQDERSISIKKWCQVRCESIFLAEQKIEERRSIDTRRAIVRAAAEIGKSMEVK